jgi:hypothetical protein
MRTLERDATTNTKERNASDRHNQTGVFHYFNHSVRQSLGSGSLLRFVQGTGAIGAAMIVWQSIANMLRERLS